MRLGYTILYVADVRKTIEFWEKAFGLERKMIVESNAYGELETGATTLGFAQHAFLRESLPSGFRAPIAGEPPPPFEIALITDDVEGAQARALKAGATLVQKPVKKPWGQIVAYVRDLDGNLVELCTAMS
jgi:catechol 2,3-dioxygenase-like lactoylglutathione lyase family enzyme